MNIFKNFFYVIKSFKSSSIINILGLSVALIVFYIIAIQVHYDFTYDKSYQKVDELLKFNLFDANKNGSSNYVNFQIPQRAAQAIPEIERYCMTAYWGKNKFDLKTGEDIYETYSISYFRATPEFLNIFTPIILLGDTTDILTQQNRAMISETTAKQLFGDHNPIGQTINGHFDKNYILEIGAVYKDFPENSSIPNGIITYLPEYEESEWSFNAYFLVKKANQKSVQTKINSKEILGEEIVKKNEENPDEKVEIQLTSLNKLYLNSAGKGGSKRINITLTLIAVGVITVLIAFVNFINLSIAMAPARVRGVNIRKILGANKVKLKLAIALESVIFTFLAIIIALTVIIFLRTTTFAKDLFFIDLSYSQHFSLLIVISLLLLFIAFLVGLYTMRFCTSVDESEALKGSFSLNKRSVRLRNILIVFQFATAIVLICVSIFIKQQNEYMLKYDWGIPRENVVYVPLSGLGKDAETFGKELLRDPRIKDYTITRDIPGKVGMSWGRNFEGKEISLRVWSVDERFFDFFDIQIIDGRKPDYMDTLVSQMVVNEAFLKKYEFTNDIVGKDFSAFGSGRIVAIAKDINFETLHEDISPMAFAVLTQWNNFNTFMVKLSGNDMAGSLEYLESTWKKFSNDPFEVHFLDKEMDKLYQNETNMANLVAIFGLVIVIIAVMGVYGLILFNAKYKSKEIAIRKINGSSEKEIIFLLNRAVLIQLLIAFIIAIPLAYYAMMKWLENFAYKSPLHWWIFPLSGILVLIIVVVTVSWQSWRAATVNPVESLKSE